MISRAKRALKNRRRKERRAGDKFNREFFSLKNQEVRRIEKIRSQRTFKELRRQRRKAGTLENVARAVSGGWVDMIQEFITGKAG